MLIGSVAHVLVVEDCPADAEWAGALLRRAFLLADVDPPAVVVVETLAAACETVQTGRFDLALVDMGLPDSDGAATVAALHRCAIGAPLIVFTGSNDEVSTHKAFVAGAADYLVKGESDASLLLRTIRHVLERQRLTIEHAQVMTAIEVMVDGFGVHSAVRDEDGSLVDLTWDYINPAGARTYRLDPTSFVGRTMRELAPGVVESGLFDDYRRVVETGEPLTKAGFGYRDLQVGGTVEGIFDIQAAKVGDGLVIIWRDVSERWQQERALAEAKDRFQSTFDGAPIGIGLVALDGKVLEANTRLGRLLGRDPTSLVGMSVLDFTYSEDVPERIKLLAQLSAGEIEGYTTDVRYVHADGHLIWVRIHSSVVHVAGKPGYTVNHIEDVTASKRNHEELLHQANHDPLTGLPNRTLLLSRLQHSLDTLDRRTGGTVAVLYLDLNGFKAINDEHGHAVGDQVLAEVGERLTGIVRRPDTVARVGGDEFVVVASLVDANEYGIIARIKTALEPLIVIDGTEFVVSVSIGTVFAQTPDDDPLELIQLADAAMYRAKQNQS